MGHCKTAGRVTASDKSQKISFDGSSSDLEHAKDMRTDSPHKCSRFLMSLGLPDLTIYFVHFLSLLVGIFLLHLQNQRREGIAVQIESILKPNATLFCRDPFA